MIGLADAHEPKECLGDAQRVGCVLDRHGGEFDDRALNSRTYVLLVPGTPSTRDTTMMTYRRYDTGTPCHTSTLLDILRFWAENKNAIIKLCSDVKQNIFS